MLGLTWSQIDLEHGTVRLDPGTTKTGAGRTVVLTQPLLEALKAAHANRRPPPWVFCRANGERRRDIREPRAKATKEAGVEGILFHDLRRSAVRNMVRRGCRSALR